MEIIAAAALGVLCGCITGIIPGLHVNTLAAIGLAMSAKIGFAGIVFFLSIGIVHTIVNILPTTYLGAPDEDEATGVLPAHRLLLAGRGPEAVSVSVAASLLGILFGVAFGAVFLHLLRGTIGAIFEIWVPFILAGAMLALWAQEIRKHRFGPLRAMSVSLVAAVLGLATFAIPFKPMVHVAPSGLLPLLGGMFGGAGLSLALQQPPSIPEQVRRAHSIRRSKPALAGSLLACITAVMPGLTSSVATAMVPGIRSRPLHAIAALSAINSAHAVLALVVWMGLGKVRTGLADVLNGTTNPGWVGLMPDHAMSMLMVTIVGSAILGAIATLALDQTLGPGLSQIPSRAMALGALVALSILVVALTGFAGGLLFGLAIVVGRMPMQLGVRRVHLVAALIVPVLILR